MVTDLAARQVHKARLPGYYIGVYETITVKKTWHM